MATRTNVVILLVVEVTAIALLISPVRMHNVSIRACMIITALRALNANHKITWQCAVVHRALLEIPMWIVALSQFLSANTTLIAHHGWLALITSAQTHALFSHPASCHRNARSYHRHQFAQ